MTSSLFEDQNARSNKEQTVIYEIFIFSQLTFDCSRVGASINTCECVARRSISSALPLIGGNRFLHAIKEFWEISNQINRQTRPELCGKMASTMSPSKVEKYEKICSKFM